MTTLLKNCLLTTLKKVNILIVDGKIKTVSENEIVANDSLQIDAVFDIKNNLVMPGIIDGFSKMKIDTPYCSTNYHSESIACAYGGITSAICVPEIGMNNDYYSNLVACGNEIKQQSIVNYAFLISTNYKVDFKEFIKAKDLSLGTIVRLEENDFNNEELKLYWTSVMDNSRLVLLHLSGFKIDSFFSFYKNQNKKIIFYDVTSENDLNRILYYRTKGYDIRVSTSINYLLLNDDLLNSEYKKKTLSLEYRLGSIINNVSLWNAIRDGKIDMITSDHMPIPLIEKFENLSPGLPGYETMFSLLLDNFNFKRISLTILENILCLNPAVSYGLKNKGQIIEGYDADLIVVNMNKRWWIKNEDIVSSARWTPFHDYKVNGKVMMTFVNGELVFNWINQMKPIRDVMPGRQLSFIPHIFNKLDFKVGNNTTWKKL